MKMHLFLALGLLAANAAQGAVTLSLGDTVGAPNSVTIVPGDSFVVTLSLASSAEATSGISYLLEGLGAASTFFRITAREITGSGFADLITGDGIALAAPNALLDPTNDNELGGLTAGAPNGTGTFKVATFTIESLAGLTTGSYMIGTNSALAFDENSDEISVNQATYNIEVVPEPGSAVLFGLGLAGVLLRRRR